MFFLNIVNCHKKLGGQSSVHTPRTRVPVSAKTFTHCRHSGILKVCPSHTMSMRLEM